MPMSKRQDLFCAHVYPGKEGRQCSYPRFFERFKEARTFDVPMDESGLCLFHSHNAKWKSDNDFLRKFIELIRLLDLELTQTPPVTEQQNRLDCRGFVFTKKTSQPCIYLSFATFKRKLDLVGSRFLDKVDFEGAVFEESAYFEDVCFHSYAHFVNCTFSGAAYFDGCEFDDFAVFRKTKFEGLASFSGTRFSAKAPTYFDEVSVAKSLVFKGRSPNQRMFSNTISIEKVTGSGSIFFENANLRYLTSNSLTNIRQLESVGQAMFGPGCDKHKVSKEVRLPYRQRHVPLIREIADAFVEFFNCDGQVTGRIGVEIEYGEDVATLRYFSDMDISQEDFEKILAQVVPQFLRLLCSPEDYFKAPLTMQQWDAYRRTKLVQLGLIPRLLLERDWSVEDTLNILSGCPGPLGIDIAINLHQHLAITNIRTEGNAQLVITNVQGTSGPLTVAPTMGDQFSNISQSTIINRSVVSNSGNSLDAAQITEIRKLVSEFARAVSKANAPAVAEPLKEFQKELSTERPTKSRLKDLWDKVLAAAPQIATVAEVMGKVTGLLG